MIQVVDPLEVSSMLMHGQQQRSSAAVLHPRKHAYFDWNINLTLDDDAREI